MPIDLRATPDGVVIPIKAVPGASRERIVGVLGDALKIAVTAAPEQGKANQAIRAVLARALGVALRDTSIESGTASRDKRVLVRGVTLQSTLARLTEITG
jgi:hypothetical protein